MQLQVYVFKQLCDILYNAVTSTVKAPNIAHLSLLTSVGYNKKETKLKKCARPNKVTITYNLYRVKNEKYFPDL